MTIERLGGAALIDLKSAKLAQGGDAQGVARERYMAALEKSTNVEQCLEIFHAAVDAIDTFSRSSNETAARIGILAGKKALSLAKNCEEATAVHDAAAGLSEMFSIWNDAQYYDWHPFQSRTLAKIAVEATRLAVRLRSAKGYSSKDSYSE